LQAGLLPNAGPSDAGFPSDAGSGASKKLPIGFLFKACIPMPSGLFSIGFSLRENQCVV